MIREKLIKCLDASEMTASEAIEEAEETNDFRKIEVENAILDTIELIRREVLS